MIRLFVLPILAVLACHAQQTERKTAPAVRTELPHLRKQGASTQMIVDGRPFLMLAGELHNSSASSLAYMKPVWKKLTALHLNTVIASVSWELLEPRENQMDFSLVDGLIAGARENHLRLVLIWFASWKNGVSSYAPMWVKTDLKRFPRVQPKSGTNLEVLSPLGEVSCQADAKAFAALMRHIRSFDSQQHTVIMMQIENEAGLLGDSRDRSSLAQAAWAQPVPEQLMNHLHENRAKLIPEFSKVWETNGARSTGTWAEVFGDNPFGDEVFMAWNIARYIGKVAEAGKAQYAIPMYANAWLVQNEGQLPGAYPSGGPVSRMMDVWRAAAPHIDLLAPDIYLPDFKAVCASYTRSGNPLFIPEAQRSAISAANVFWAAGQHDAMGFAPFGIDGVEEGDPLAASYRVLAEMMPVIAMHQGTGRMIGVLEDKQPNEALSLGGFKLRIDYRRDKPAGIGKAFGLVIATAPDEFLVAGSGFSVGFSPDSPGPTIARIGSIEEGRFENGMWVAGRRLNGDENGGGARLALPSTEIGIQKIKLYRHD